mmetsp:Transcript_29591/g.67849  ORF Transcript_29591/g.67849 Transcript_29591/m.67849 type:complete len:489 (-) Transcript_29591:149-1615(-)
MPTLATPPSSSPPRAPSPHFLYSGRRTLRMRVVADFHPHAGPMLPDGVWLRDLGKEDAGVSGGLGPHRVGGNRFDYAKRGAWGESSWRGNNWYYLPFFYADSFDLLRCHALPMSDDLRKPDPLLRIDWAPRSLLAHRLLFHADSGFSSMGAIMGMGESELDDVRELVAEERLWRLAIEQLFGWLHMYFAYLAFSSEVAFWRGREDTGGLSARTLLLNAGCSFVILCYLWDDERTNRILLLSSTFDFAVQTWKVARLLAARAARARWLRAAALAVSLTDGAPAGENSTDSADFAAEAARVAATEKFDALGGQLVGASIAPLTFGLALYTLVYYPHRSWWSWALDAAAKCVYLLGFVGMTPQLFVNYKLKSVSHLPWRVLCYKAFSTFVDDAFSLLVSMPTAHRIACLRDDAVFLVLLYQRRCYPVDKRRSNEYGYAYAPAAAAAASPALADEILHAAEATAGNDERGGEVGFAPAEADRGRQVPWKLPF